MRPIYLPVEIRRKDFDWRAGLGVSLVQDD